MQTFQTDYDHYSTKIPNTCILSRNNINRLSTLAVGFPAPWPDFVSTRIIRGLFCKIINYTWVIKQLLMLWKDVPIDF